MESATAVRKNKRRFTSRLKKQLPSIAFLSPFTIFFVMFTIVPILAAIVLSFTYFNMVSAPTFVGFDNYIRLFFNDDVFLIALRNTAIFAMITGPISYILSFFVAWLINEFNRTVRTILTLIFYLPSLAGNVYFVWTYIFSGDSYGFLNSILMRLGMIFGPVQWLTDTKYMMAVVIVVILWLSLGTGFLSFVAGLQSLNRELFEAAAIDGAGEWTVFSKITLPMTTPILAVNALNHFIAAYNSWEWAFLVCQKESQWTIAVWMYQMSQEMAGQPWCVMAGFVLVSIPTALVFLLCQKVILRGIVLPSMK